MALRGRLELVCAAGAGDGQASLLKRRFHSGPFHVSKSYWDGGVLLCQIANPTPGYLAGDRSDVSVRVESGARLLLSWPSATRIHTMPEGTEARARAHYSVAAGGWLEVWPEWTIPQVGSAFSSETVIDLEPGAGLFAVELLLPGRVARGERFAWRSLSLATEVRMDGRPVLVERLDQPGPSFGALAASYGFEAPAFGSIVIAGELAGAAALHDLLRPLHRNDAWLGVSAPVPELSCVKMVARDPADLRGMLLEVRRRLSGLFPGLGSLSRRAA